MDDIMTVMAIGAIIIGAIWIFGGMAAEVKFRMG
jgi:hypothetical protein